MATNPFSLHHGLICYFIYAKKYVCGYNIEYPHMYIFVHIYVHIYTYISRSPLSIFRFSVSKMFSWKTHLSSGHKDKKHAGEAMRQQLKTGVKEQVSQKVRESKKFHGHGHPQKGSLSDSPWAEL